MTKRVLLILGLGCCISLSAYAQTISGKIIDSLKMEPVAFANIVLADGIHGTTTDIEGHFNWLCPLATRN
jgi:hypothetical protein